MVRSITSLAGFESVNGELGDLEEEEEEEQEELAMVRQRRETWREEKSFCR